MSTSLSNEIRKSYFAAIYGPLVYAQVMSALLEQRASSRRNHQARGDRSQPLQLNQVPAEVAAYLDDGLAIADLTHPIMQSVLRSAGMTADLSQYDLSKWGSPASVYLSGFNYIDLTAAALTDGKPFEALKVGSFTDMHGRAVTFTAERLKKIFTNTRAALTGRKDGQGKEMGFPIDAADHNRGDAAGWIVGIDLAGEIIRLVPQWTALGVEKIEKGMQRLFSCTLNPETDTIIGGTLTNWPAVEGLNPIELQEA